ncbi:fasciclin-like arabinogalactan protein 9 [Capsicum chacoense]
MAHQKPLSLILLSLIPLFFILFPQTIQAQSPTAPAPAPTGPIDIFAILKKENQYNTFIKFLNETQVGTQINNQVNNSNEGMTVFAPSDNAFNNLPGGTLNKLNDQQKVQLIQYHVIPKFYTFDDLQTVSNPVRTQATGQKGEPFGLNFTGQNNQVNVSSGVVTTNIYNAIRKERPLAVFQLDKVLLPVEFTDAKAPSTDDAPAPSGDTTKKGTSADNTKAKEPSPASTTPNDAKRISVGILGLISGVFLMGALS